MPLGRSLSLLVATGLTLGLAVSCGRNARTPAAEAAAGAPGTQGTPGTPGTQGADAASGPAKAPWGLNYPADPAVFGKGVEIAPQAPFYSGGPATSFTVKPPLPAGLVLNPGTGAISGAPAQVAATATYRVTASNALGSTETNLTLTVNDQAPVSAPVVALPARISATKAGVVASIPDLGRGMTYVWNLTGGTLTGGQGTPAITFTAGGPGPLTAAVTASNSGGSVSARAEAVIVPLPNASMNYQGSTQPGGSVTATVAAAEGMTIQWTVVPGSASATLSSGQGTGQASITAGSTAGSFQIQVQVQNQAGDAATASGTVKVN
jgi:hypothetical protein